jgi:hypothetical protein
VIMAAKYKLMKTSAIEVEKKVEMGLCFLPPSVTISIQYSEMYLFPMPLTVLQLFDEMPKCRIAVWYMNNEMENVTFDLFKGIILICIAPGLLSTDTDTDTGHDTDTTNNLRKSNNSV